MRVLIVILFIILPLNSQAAIYKWKDANGHIVFSSVPPVTSDAQKSLETIGDNSGTKIDSNGGHNKHYPKQELRHTGGHDHSTRNIDLVNVSAHLNGNKLEVGFLYKNTDIDKLVFWKNASVATECKAYENLGSLFEPERGQLISTLSKVVTSFGQDIYMGVPARYLGRGLWAIVECQIDTGWNSFTDADDCKLGN